MNLHVTNDEYGFYTSEIAERIKNPEYAGNNLIVNLSATVTIKSDIVTYIPITEEAFSKFILSIPAIEKIIFHPYNLLSYKFLVFALKKYPKVKVYWICWSYEFYNLPHVVDKLYSPFAKNYLQKKISIKQHVTLFTKKIIKAFLQTIKIRKSYQQQLNESYTPVNYFCSPFPTDFFYLNQIIPANSICYEPFAYLSLNKIMPDLHTFKSTGNKIMIGHSSLPEGNHYEVIKKISAINKNYSIVMPLVYGDMQYGDIIKKIAKNSFSDIEFLETKLEKVEYYKKLCEVGWAVINVKVQQAVGNIIGLIWMGAKVFLDKHSSVYIDFVNWGICVFNIQDDMNSTQLETKLTDVQVENNKRIILDRFGDEASNKYWKKILE